jgi:hypothetical protein
VTIVTGDAFGNRDIAPFIVKRPGRDWEFTFNPQHWYFVTGYVGF